MQRQAHAAGPPILSDEQQYLLAVASFPSLSQAQERDLVARARAGENVRDEIILSLQRRVYALAARYIRFVRAGMSVERLDLAQSATLAMLHRFELALSKSNPYSYLLRIAHLTMIDCINGRNGMIKTRTQEYIPVLSLDRAVHEDGTSLADLLPDEVSMPSSHALAGMLPLIHQAIETLPEKQRLVIQRHYGFGYAPESLNRISRNLSARTQRASHAQHHYKKALSALEHALAPHFPQYRSGGVQ